MSHADQHASFELAHRARQTARALASASAALALGSLVCANELALGAAPRLGAPLELELSAAPAHALYAIGFSPSAASLPLGFGTLELAPAGLVVLGGGAAGANGSAQRSFATPASPAFAEFPVHVQALVIDPQSQALALTNALHLRLIGPRAYVGESASPAAGARFAAYSAVSGALVFERDDEVAAALVPSTAGADEAALVVLGKHAARAAYTPDRERLLIVDNFHGGLLHEVPLGALECAPQLLVDVQGEHVYALTREALLRVSFASGALSALPLSRAAELEWARAGDGPEAWIAAEGGVGAAASLLRVDLDSFQELAPVELVPAQTGIGRHLGDLAWMNGRLLAVGWTAPLGENPLSSTGFFATIQPLGPAGATVQLGAPALPALVDVLALPELDLALGTTNNFLQGGIGLALLAPAAPSVSAPLPAQPMFFHSSAPVVLGDGEQLWVRSGDIGDGGYALHAFAPASVSWTPQANIGCYPGARDLARVQGPFADALVLAAPSNPFECGGAWSELVLRDPHTGATRYAVPLAGQLVLLETIELD